MHRWTLRRLCLAALALNLAACAAPADQPQPAADAAARPAGWGDASHGDAAAPDYAAVFPQDKVNQLTITIDPAAWQAMQDDMAALYGEQGSMPAGRFFPGGDVITGTGDMLMPPPEGAMIPFPGGPLTATAGMPGGRMMGGELPSQNPMWVTATLGFAGGTWTNVGVRYKGNSSLMSGWREGGGKLPFKLDFDQFEDAYPSIKNQRFYGFKQLSLASNLGDATGMRETIAYDLLEQAGLPAAQTAAYEVFVDRGAGPERLGLYTMIEVIDDTVIERAFADGGGAIYEGDGRAASLAAGTRDALKDSFQKESDDGEGWAAIEELYDILHDPARASDPAAWRARLEAAFDVPSFLKWLALSAIIQHWDTYGAMTHNFYLYHDPATGKLAWISWDHNFVLGASGGPGGPQSRPAPNGQARPAPQGGPPGPGGRQLRMGGGGALDKKDVGAEWPLIRFLLDDPAYYAAYVSALRETLAGFDPDRLAATYQGLAKVIGPAAARDGSQAEYDAAVAALMAQIRARAEAVGAFLATQQ